MREHLDIYKKEKALEATILRIKESSMSSRNKKFILDFQTHCFAEGLSVHRVYQYLNTLPHFAEWLGKDFDKAKKEDIVAMVQKFERMEYAPWTKMGFKTTLKKFYKWLRQSDNPVEVTWISTTKKNMSRTLPEELITEPEVKKLIDAVEHPRDKALVSLLFESGCRVGEILSLHVRNVEFDKYGTVLIVSGKTGSRRVRVISATPYLAAWISSHPDKDNPNAPLWVGIGTRKRHDNIEYAAVRMLLQRSAKKAGIKKKVYPHLFRHSRATYLASRLTEAQMNEYFGWVQGSNMPSTYVHLSGRDVDNALLKIHDLVKEDEKEVAPLKPKLCVRCEMLNPATGKFCSRCGAVIDVQAAQEVDQGMKLLDERLANLLHDPAVQDFLINRIKGTAAGSP